MQKVRANQDIRVAAKQAQICLWELADALGIGSTALTIMLRHELPREKKNELLGVIKKLKQEAV